MDFPFRNLEILRCEVACDRVPLGSLGVQGLHELLLQGESDVPPQRRGPGAARIH